MLTCPGLPVLQRLAARLASANANGVGQIGNKDFPVADLPRLCRLEHGVDDQLCLIISNSDLDFHFGDEVDGIFGAPIGFGMPLLPAKASDFGDGHTGDAHIFQLKMPNDCFDFFHGSSFLGGW